MSEAGDILRKVEEKRDRARDLGVDKLLSDLYFEFGLRRYTTGMHHEHQCYKSIFEARDIGEDATIFVINGTEYELRYE